MISYYLPAILVPLVGIIFPAFGMALLFIHIQKTEIE
jgi:photosystem I reaction center subunit VIII